MVKVAARDASLVSVRSYVTPRAVIASSYAPHAPAQRRVHPRRASGVCHAQNKKPPFCWQRDSGARFRQSAPAAFSVQLTRTARTPRGHSEWCACYSRNDLVAAPVRVAPC